MPDYIGAIQHAVLSRTLWLLPAPLFVGLVWHLVLAYRRASGARPAPSARFVGMAAVGLATGVTLGHVVALGPRRSFVQPLGGGARIGPLDAGFGLCFDPLSALGCAYACVVALGVAGYLSTRPAGQSWRTWAWIELALAGAMIATLADGLPTLALGWTLAVAAGMWLAGWTEPRRGAIAATRGALALLALALGTTLVFWGLGGSWRGDDYVREVGPPYAPMRAGGAGARAGVGAGWLSLIGAPGGAVYVDEARVPVVTAPFVGLSIQPGRHEIRVHSSAASEDAVVDVIMPPEGEALALVPAGPSLSFRDLAALSAIETEHDGSLLRRRLHDRAGPFGLDVVGLAFALWTVAVWSVRPTYAAIGAPIPLALLAYAATESILGPLLFARAAVLVPLAPWTAGALAVATVAGLVSAVVALGRALRREEAVAPPGAAPWLEAMPARLGALLVRFEQWVVDAAVGLASALLAVAAWVTARVDHDLVVAPADAVGSGVARGGRALQALVGGSLVRAMWIALAVAAAAIAAQTIWQSV